MRNLQEIMKERHAFESYPIQFLEDNGAKTEEDFVDILTDVVRKIQRLSDGIISEEIISEKDLTDVKFFLTEKLYELRTKKEENGTD
jgi:hypothetical protein